MPIEPINLLDGKFVVYPYYQEDPGASSGLKHIDVLGILEGGLRKASKKLGHSGVKIDLYGSDTQFEGVVLGSAMNSDIMDLGICYKTPNLAEVLPTAMGGTVAHELHHNKRIGALGYVRTLAERLVKDGLATKFEHDMYPDGKIYSWSRPLDEKETEYFWGLCKTRLGRDVTHDKWFFGDKDTVLEDGSIVHIPKYAGYRMGTMIVDDYQKSHPEASLVDLASVQATEIIQGSKYGLLADRSASW